MVYQAKLAVLPGLESRSVPRREVDFGGFVRETGATVTRVAVTDLSTEGCRFQSAGNFETATMIWLKIDGVGAREARIVWRAQEGYGCEFLAPMQIETLDGICAQRTFG